MSITFHVNSVRKRQRRSRPARCPTLKTPANYNINTLRCARGAGSLQAISLTQTKPQD